MFFVCNFRELIGSNLPYIDGVLHGINLEFVEFPVSHTGKNIAKEVIKVLKTYQLENKVIGIVADNASNNDIAIKEITELLELADNTFPGKNEFHFRCFGHIMNLACKGVYH